MAAGRGRGRGGGGGGRGRHGQAAHIGGGGGISGDCKYLVENAQFLSYTHLKY